jgi:hypothetical protein
MMDYLSPFTKGGKTMEPTGKPEPANWEITAFSLRCDYIGDMVTVRVARDWLATCAWYLKYKTNATKESKQGIDKAIKQRIDKCLGPNCPIVTKYREKLIEEDFGKK